MRKLFAIILAVLMLTGITLTAHAEETDFNFQALEALAEKIKANAQGGFGTSENPTYIWRVDMPYPQGRECWLQWTEPQDSPQNGTLDVQIRKEDGGVYFLRWLLGAADYCEVSWFDEQTIPGYYPTSRMEPYKPKRGDDVDYIIGKINVSAYVPGAQPKGSTVQTNISGIYTTEQWTNYVAEIPWLVDVIQYNLDDGYTLRNIGFYSSGVFCRFHVFGEPIVTRPPTTTNNGLQKYVCERCERIRLEAIPRLPFDDVPPTSYYAEAVDWAVENEITSGDGESTFGPGKKCTRAQIVTMLWRAAGSPEAEGENYFHDVPATAYYAEAVAWAYKNGVTKGAGDGCFDPNAPCTRAQIVTMLWRANGSPEEETNNRFLDVRKGAWYALAVHWAAGNGVTTGTGGGEFSPNVICTRAQVVTMLWKNGGEG